MDFEDENKNTVPEENAPEELRDGNASPSGDDGRIPGGQTGEIEADEVRGEETETLDDTRRIKVLSPGMLVFKRFIRNKLAIFGTVILLFMFAFCFIGGWAGKYKQDEVFYTYGTIRAEYGMAMERTEAVIYYIADENAVSENVKFGIHSILGDMKETGKTKKCVTEDGSVYLFEKKGICYYVSACADGKWKKTATALTEKLAATVNKRNGNVQLAAGYALPAGDEDGFKSALEASSGMTEFTYEGRTYSVSDAGPKFKTVKEVLATPELVAAEGETAGDDLKAAAEENIPGADFFDAGGKTYAVVSGKKGEYEILRLDETKSVFVTTNYVFNYFDDGFTATMNNLELTEFQKKLYEHLFDGVDYEIDGVTYRTTERDGGYVVQKTEADGAETDFAELSTFVFRRKDGADTVPLGLKKAFRVKYNEMVETGEYESTFVYPLPVTKADGTPVSDEDGNPEIEDVKFEVLKKANNFVLRNDQTKYLMDIYGRPGRKHILGTDANGMDVLTRIMYGGRISLMIGFIVVFLEIILGVIMGGIAGYFGGWCDQLIMRLVDIFYCIPSMPILIILGAMFDKLHMDSYMRIMYLMIILGVLGWPGIARLVRGQILSLREQEFMIAAEAAGLTARRKIFRHLIPNVMPQLIVNATMGLGGIILTESTLSFLGLGAKYPLATWGAMINSVSTPDAMENYVYIWLPVGLLICLTVIAFNFVGDGLRDAFDPKMKR